MSDEVTRQAAEAQSERSVSREHYDWMVQNRNEWQQQAEALGGAAQRMTLDNCRLVAERDAAMADLKQAEENNRGLMIEVQNMRAGLVFAERDMERAECEKLRKDLQEITIELEVAEDEAQVFKERLIKEQKVVLQLAEENDRLSIELDSRRTAFLQMVVEMGKVSKEMLSV